MTYTRKTPPYVVTPAKAGVQGPILFCREIGTVHKNKKGDSPYFSAWIPAFAGMTGFLFFFFLPPVRRETLPDRRAADELTYDARAVCHGTIAGDAVLSASLFPP